MIECPECDGSGDCQKCSSKGKVPAAGATKTKTCGDCDGDGRCPQCDGIGKLSGHREARPPLTVLGLIDAANQLTALLEAATPKGLKHARHAKTLKAARAAIKSVMAGYFRRQGNAVLAILTPKVPLMLRSHPYQESAGGKSFASSLIPSSLHPLRFAVTAGETAAYDAAIQGAIAGAARVLAAEMKSGATIGEDVAGDWLRENSLTKLTGGFSETSLDRLRNAVGDAWDRGGSADQIVAAIKDTFETFSTIRAETIAVTEVNNAYNAGRDALADAMGMEEKAWETESGNPCDICLANEAQGYIDIGEDFESGDDSPTAHVRCECSLNYRKGHAD